MVIFNMIDGTPARDYMIIKAYKTATDITKAEDNISEIVNGDFSLETFDKVAEVLSDGVGAITNLEYLQENIQKITEDSECDAIWILPIPEGLIDSFMHSYADDTDENGDHNLQGIEDQLKSGINKFFGKGE